jgi:hypothetical protein
MLFFAILLLVVNGICRLAAGDKRHPHGSDTIEVPVCFCCKERGPYVFAGSGTIEERTVAADDDLSIVNADPHGIGEGAIDEGVHLIRAATLDVYLACRKVSASAVSDFQWYP